MDRWDWLFVAGVIAGGVGLWLVHPAASLVSVGIVACIIAVSAARPSKPSSRGGE